MLLNFLDKSSLKELDIESLLISSLLKDSSSLIIPKGLLEKKDLILPKPIEYFL